MRIFFANPHTRRFFESIEENIRPSVTKGFDLLVVNEYNLGLPLSRALGSGLFELRIIDQTHIRFIYTFHAGDVYVLHGFVKKSEKISKKDLNYARDQKKRLQ